MPWTKNSGNIYRKAIKASPSRSSLPGYVLLGRPFAWRQRQSYCRLWQSLLLCSVGTSIDTMQYGFCAACFGEGSWNFWDELVSAYYAPQTHCPSYIVSSWLRLDRLLLIAPRPSFTLPISNSPVATGRPLCGYRPASRRSDYYVVVV